MRGEKSITDLQAVLFYSPFKRVHNLPANQDAQVDEQHPTNDNQQLLVLYDLKGEKKMLVLAQ